MTTDDEDFLERITGDVFDRDGYAISMRRWAELREDFYGNVLVARTTRNHVRISTVWLGLNHSWYRDSAPVIFETMTFPLRDRDRRASWHGHVWRWRTEEEARAGHASLAEQVRQRGVWALLRQC